MASDDVEPRPETDEEQRRRADEGVRSAIRDRTMTRLDEADIRERLLLAFDAFVALGYMTHLIGVTMRGRIDYRLQLEPDGADDVPIRAIMAVADEHRLDVVVDKTLGLVLYPRW